jgi:23S rRNA G2445 N2-methylase RlmL
MSNMNKPKESFFAPCPRGLEALLAQELTGLGAQQVTAGYGGVAFVGAVLSRQPAFARRQPGAVAHRRWRV